MKVLVTTAVFKSMMGCMGRLGEGGEGGDRVWVPVARGESISINNSPSQRGGGGGGRNENLNPH